jgi:hypothetical protein
MLRGMRWTEGGLVMDAPYSPLDLNSTVTRVVIYLAYVFRPKSVVLGTSSVATVCSVYLPRVAWLRFHH